MAHTTKSLYATRRSEALKRSTRVISSSVIHGRKIYGGFMGGCMTWSSCNRDFRPILYQSVRLWYSTVTSPKCVSPELIICRSPYVKYCTMFGSNRPCVGVLIEPDGDNVEIFDPAEVDLLTMFRNSVWWGLIICFSSYLLIQYYCNQAGSGGS